MDSKKYEQLEEMLCNELEEIVDKGELSAGSLETIDKLTHALKNTYKIHMGEEGGYSQDGGYAMDGDWTADMRGSYGRGNSYGRYSRTNYGRDNGNSYGNGSSYARRGMHYVRGHYSRDDAKGQMIDHLEQAMDMADNDNARNIIRKAIETVDRA